MNDTPPSPPGTPAAASPDTTPTVTYPGEPGGAAPADTTPPTTPWLGPTGISHPTVPGYEILAELGRGGMGVVYKARQTSLNRVVALKMILSGAGASQTELSRFFTEAEAVAHLQHPNIVQIFETGFYADRPYFTLEFVEGGTLAAKVREQVLPSDEAARLVESLARGMHYAHQKDVVHRDLKPANVLLTPDGTPKVTDFGLAKKVEGGSGLTQTGAVMGSPSYMAPEQALGQTGAIGPAADVYALGAILYECLTGRPPFKGASIPETLAQVCERDPVPPRQLQPKVPPDLQTVCLTCLQKSTSRRYATALDLAEDLRRFREREPIRARPASLRERAGKWVRRRPAAAALVAVSLIAVLGAVAGVTAYTLELEHRAAWEHDQKVIAQALQKKAEEKEVAAQVATAKAREETQRANDAVRKEQQATLKERQANLKAVRNLYELRVNRVAQAVADAKHDEAMIELDQMRPENAGGPDQRGFEWYYWDRLLNAHVRKLSLTGVEKVSGAAYSPGGRLFVYARGSILTFVSPYTGRFRATTFCQHGLTDLAFSPDGRYLASASARPSILLQDLGRPEKDLPADERVVFRMPPPHQLKGADFLHGHRKMARAVAFSPDGKLLASAGADGRVVLWDPVTRKDVKVLYGPREGFVRIAFRPDGKRLAVAHSGGTIHVWELPGYKPLPPLRVPGFAARLRCLAYRPKGDVLVAGDAQGRLHFWAADSGAYRRTVYAHNGGIHALAFSADGSRLVTAGGDRAVRVWEGVVLFAKTRFIGHALPVTVVAFRPDGGGIASGDERTLKFWDARKDPAVTPLPRPARAATAVAFSPDSRRLAAATHNGDLEIWELAQPRCVVRVKALARELLCVAWQPGGTAVAVAGGDGPIRLRDGRDGKEGHTLQGHRGPVRALAFSPDGKLLASGGDDGVIRLWDVASGKSRHVLPGHPRHGQNPGTVRGLAFHPDGRRLASIGYDAWLRFWDVDKGVQEEAHRVTGAMQECLAFDRTGAFLVYGTSADAALRLYPLKDGFRERDKKYLFGHRGGITGVTFAPDGKRLVSASRDGTVRLWNTTTLFQEVLSLPAGNGVSGLAVSGDGRLLAAGGAGGELLLWDGSPRPPSR